MPADSRRGRALILCLKSRGQKGKKVPVKTQTTEQGLIRFRTVSDRVGTIRFTSRFGIHIFVGALISFCRGATQREWSASLYCSAVSGRPGI